MSTGVVTEPRVRSCWAQPRSCPARSPTRTLAISTGSPASPTGSGSVVRLRVGPDGWTTRWSAASTPQEKPSNLPWSGPRCLPTVTSPQSQCAGPISRCSPVQASVFRSTQPSLPIRDGKTEGATTPHQKQTATHLFKQPISRARPRKGQGFRSTERRSSRRRLGLMESGRTVTARRERGGISRPLIGIYPLARSDVRRA